MTGYDWEHECRWCGSGVEIRTMLGGAVCDACFGAHCDWDDARRAGSRTRQAAAEAELRRRWKGGGPVPKHFGTWALEW